MYTRAVLYEDFIRVNWIIRIAFGPEARKENDEDDFYPYKKKTK